MFSHKSNFSQRLRKKKNIEEKSNNGYLQHPLSTNQSSLYTGALREEGGKTFCQNLPFTVCQSNHTEEKL